MTKKYSGLCIVTFAAVIRSTPLVFGVQYTEKVLAGVQYITHETTQLCQTALHLTYQDCKIAASRHT